MTKMVKFHYETKHTNAYIFKVWVFKNIVIDSSLNLTRVNLSMMHETRVSTVTVHKSTNHNTQLDYQSVSGFEPMSSVFLDECPTF